MLKQHFFYTCILDEYNTTLILLENSYLDRDARPGLIVGHLKIKEGAQLELNTYSVRV